MSGTQAGAAVPLGAEERERCLTAAVEANVPLSTIAEVLGHAHTTTTPIHAHAYRGEGREFVSRVWSES